ncbi:serine acetyltransferase [Methylobacterium sp. E-016]|uniref:serine O-acetyltransferase n=1 Tax=Methylobacterium sp. E-016 TaxID=2836556 RepID=UPI001FB922E7|nr:serine acetyltransferase [Methylobacterium sp. E-016]MCJ2076355.1 serine acetyltransferase [Methylobacterium sp. E-016]
MRRAVAIVEHAIGVGAEAAPSPAVSPPGWWSAYRADFARYREMRPGTTTLVLVLTEQGLWALLQYRAAAGIYRSRLFGPLKRAVLLGAGIAQKLIEMTTGISLPYRARIGPGLYIGHFGNIIVHEDAVIGDTCNISQGVTVGTSGRGSRRGAPVIGNRVYVATNAVVAGRIEVGDDSVVGANSLVTRDVPAGSTVLGVPALIVGHRGSAAYLVPHPGPIQH